VTSNLPYRIVELPQSPLCAHTYAVNAVVFSDGGLHVCTCSQDGRVCVWDTRTGDIVAQLRHASQQSLRACHLAPGGHRLLTGSDDETACIWRIGGGETVGADALEQYVVMHCRLRCVQGAAWS
jgi:WD40 repeat protein